MSVILKEELNEVLQKHELKKKELARKSHFSSQTITDWTGGNPKPVTINNAEILSKELNDSKFTLTVAHKFLGILKGLDGDLFNTDSPNDLEILGEQEEEERIIRKREAQRILAKRKNKITPDDQQVLITYANEFLDEIIIELTIVISIFKISGLSLMDAVKKRMPYWVRQGYMKKG